MYRNRPHLYMFVGLPGSGKSTFRRDLIHKHIGDVRSTIILSTDDYIEMEAQRSGSTYNEVFQSTMGAAGEHLDRMLKTALDGKHNIVWDQTNLTAKTRSKKLKKIPDDYYKAAVYMKTSKDHILATNDERKLTGRAIPNNILNAMIDQIVRPEIHEGFESIIEIERGF